MRLQYRESKSKERVTEDRRSGTSLIFIFVEFGMLWLPLGQQDFLIQHWMKLGLFMAPFLLFVAISFRSATTKERRDMSIWSLVLLVVYIVHQFEEHWVDFFVNHYAFKSYLNDLVIERFGNAGQSVGPLSDAGVFAINTSLVWLVAILAIWKANRHSFPALCLASIVWVNACSHVAAALLTIEYNPGLLTAVILFFPMGTAAYLWSLRCELVSVHEVIASLIWGGLAHVIMIAGLLASGWFHIFPERVYFALLVIWSILPVFLYRSKSAKAISI